MLVPNEETKVLAFRCANGSVCATRANITVTDECCAVRSQNALLRKPHARRIQRKNAEDVGLNKRLTRPLVRVFGLRDRQ